MSSNQEIAKIPTLAAVLVKGIYSVFKTSIPNTISKSGKWLKPSKRKQRSSTYYIKAPDESNVNELAISQRILDLGSQANDSALHMMSKVNSCSDADLIKK